MRSSSVCSTQKLSLVVCILISLFSVVIAQGPSPLNPPAYFSDDFYKVRGGPYLQISLERSSVYQGDKTSLFLTLTNRGNISSFEINNMPAANRPEEVYAAQRELELESQKPWARDISIRLVPLNGSSMEIKREVAYGGSLRDGQVSSRLEFPIEIFEDTKPGDYELDAIMNYTYQKDVAVVGSSDRPMNPDVYYWYDSASQMVPLRLNVNRLSGADLKAVAASPRNLSVGSKNNVITVIVENRGRDLAKDIIARLRPEAGIYVGMDESPIPLLEPGQRAELIYTIDVSKDAIPGKPYRLTINFDFSDSYRTELEDSDHIYITIEPNLTQRYWWLLIIAVVALAIIVIFLIKRRRRRGAG
jgi:hypothetical protein